MAKIAVSPLLKNEVRDEFITSIAAAAKMKHNAELIFIGSQCGLILLKTEMLKPQPTRSKKLSRITRIRDIRIVLLNLPDRPGKRLVVDGIFYRISEFYSLTIPKIYKISRMKKYNLNLDDTGYFSHVAKQVILVPGKR